jgi:CheY-like chemotaxis protein
MHIRRRVNVLVVGASALDQQLYTQAFKGSRECTLAFAADSDHALALLQTSPRLPVLILLLAHSTSELVLLEVLKRSERYSGIPMVVLSEPASQDVGERAYELGCNSVLVKPLERAEYEGMLGRLIQYWFWAVQLSVYPPITVNN